MHKAIYPGSFDPPTFGHLDIIQRAAKHVDKLVVGVLDNNLKSHLFPVEERVEMLKEITKDIPNIEVTYFNGLLVDFARMQGAKLIVRGLRAVSDFEFELQLAQTNKAVYPEIDTMFLNTSAQYSFLSSSFVKDIAKYGGDTTLFVPEYINERLKSKFKGEQQ